MKTNIMKLLSAALVLLFVSTGCEDFLEEDNRDTLTTDAFFSSDGAAVLAVNGVYRRIFADNAFYGDIRGINLFIRLGADDLGHAKLTGNNTNNLVIGAYTITETDNEEVEQVWNSAYAAINAANLVIQGVNNNRTLLSDEIANRSIGEVLFLRALMYYHLTNLWGDVPFFEGSPDLSVTAEMGRVDKDVIRLAQIEALTRIEDEGLLSASEYSGSDRGRPTLWAAKMLKAKIMMWREDWAGALAECQDIINSGQYRLLPNFADIFNTGQMADAADVYHNETIFGYDFNSSVEGGNVNGDKTWRLFTPNGSEEGNASSDPNNFDFAGLDLPNGQVIARGTGIIVSRFDFFDRFPEGPRKEATFSDGTDISLNNVAFPSGSIHIEKLWSLEPSVGGRNGDFLMLFRYADALLMAAEAAAELGQDAAARGYLDLVQERGNGTASPTSANGLLQDIRDERAYELTGEGFRRYDLIRWGELVNVVSQLTPLAPANHDIGANILNVSRPDMLPIPPDEFLTNPVLLESDPTNNGYR